MPTKYWQHDDRLKAVRDRIAELGANLVLAELHLKQAVKYTRPPDEAAADRALLACAHCHEQIGLGQRELVRLRQLIKAEYEAHGATGQDERKPAF